METTAKAMTECHAENDAEGTCQGRTIGNGGGSSRAHVGRYGQRGESGCRPPVIRLSAFIAGGVGALRHVFILALSAAVLTGCATVAVTHSPKNGTTVKTEEVAFMSGRVSFVERANAILETVCKSSRFKPLPLRIYTPHSPPSFPYTQFSSVQSWRDAKEVIDLATELYDWMPKHVNAWTGSC